MTAVQAGTLFGSRFGQVCWVVPDIKASEKFFCEMLGVPKFLKLEGLSAKDTQGTYMGRPADFVFDLYLSYSGDTMLEIIQPHSGVRDRGQAAPQVSSAKARPRQDAHDALGEPPPTRWVTASERRATVLRRK